MLITERHIGQNEQNRQCRRRILKEKSCGTFCIKEDWTTMLSGAILTLQTNI